MATPNLLLSDMRLIRANPDLTKEVLRMAGKQSLYEKQLERIVKAVGDDLLEQMPPEVRVRGLTLEERLRGLNLDTETLEKLKQLINGQDGVSS
jgi:hypothetical protein